MTDELIERVARLDTATISDALDKLGIAGQCRGIKPLDHRFRMTGRAYTVAYGPIDSANPGTVGDYIDDLARGTVVVLANDGREDATVWGDILTWLAHTNALAGTVIDGASRDTQLSREIGYPIYSRSYSMRTGKDRVQVIGQDIPVTIGQARVCPGDLLRGDADGVVVIPRARELEIIEAAEAIHRAEEAIRRLIAAGRSLREAREELKYHELQRRTRS